jgi:hypothetical protein
VLSRISVLAMKTTSRYTFDPKSRGEHHWQTERLMLQKRGGGGGGVEEKISC